MFCFIKKVVRHKMKRIQSNLQSIGTYDLNKIRLSCSHDKKFVLDDGINTLAYFIWCCFFKSIDVISKVLKLF